MNISTRIETFSSEKIFHLTAVNIRDVQLDIKRLLVPINDDQIEEASIFLKIVSGNLNVKVTKKFSAKMEQMTKKKPSKKITI